MGPITRLSRCRGQNAEVEDAVDPRGRYVYAEWIGCRGIGFARSTDGGAHFKRPISLPDSGGGWDPSVAVAPNGTVYAVYMITGRSKTFPVVATSFDHGRSFPRVTFLIPPAKGNWGDRDFVATGPGNTVYVTWDYGPSGSSIKLDCPSNGSCAITAGELNIVMQASTDGGKTFGPMSEVSPGFPNGGADSAPLVVEPNGRIDVLYTGFRVTNRRTDAVGAGHNYFTSSSDGGRTWSRPVAVGRATGKISSREWWIDGALGRDGAGNLYATWDTQGRRGDLGWLAFSSNQGVTWSRPVQVSPDHARVPHIVQAVGGPAGIAYVGWLTVKRGRGYAQYLRTFSIRHGWISAPRRISRQFGNPSVWPGDTFGIVIRSARALILSWGSATPQTPGKSEIFGAPVRLPLG